MQECLGERKTGVISRCTSTSQTQSTSGFLLGVAQAASPTPHAHMGHFARDLGEQVAASQQLAEHRLCPQVPSCPSLVTQEQAGPGRALKKPAFES